MTQFKIISVNLSEKKGTIKKPVPMIELTGEGIVGDAHAGRWHRQVSLLGTESIKKFGEVAGRDFLWGEFAENITTEGLILYQCRPFDKFINDNVIMEVTQIGKVCHGDSCAIYRETGNCVMPREGIFCRVLKGGKVMPGDTFVYHEKIMKVLVVTLSDRASSGEYTDRSGAVIHSRITDLINKNQWPVEVVSKIIPDEAPLLKKIIEDEFPGFDIIFTTGGTGLGPRDITTDTLKPLIHKEIPGIMEMVRAKYGSANPNALISRSLAGLIGNTLLFALPGSVKAVNEYLDEIEKVLVHLIFMVKGIDKH